MKQNYIDGKGVYHNELNLTLTQIYDSGVEFGCKVTAEGIIEELEKIKEEIKDLDLEFFDEDYRAGVARGIMEFNKILNKHISELKGEQE